MPHTCRTRLSILSAVVAIGLFCPIVRADPLPTLDEMKQMLKDEKYKELTPALQRAISLKGPDAEQYPKRDLYELKGEVSLHTKAKQAAVEAFTAAAKATDKPDEAAADTGVALLIKASAGNLKYTPKPKEKADKGDKPEPIDIVDPDSRKKALAALAHDMLAVKEPKVTAAVKGTDLNQMAIVAKDLLDLRAVEIAGTGAPTDSKQLMGDLGTRTTKLMGDALDQMTKNLDDEVTAYNDSVGGQSKPSTAGHSEKVPTFSDLGRDAASASSNAKSIQAQAKTMGTVFGDVADFRVIDQKSKQLIGNADRLVNQVKKQGG